MNKGKKRKTKRKNRLFILMQLLLMTTLSLSITSYAWFSTNRLTRVDLLNVNVRTQGGIEISTDGTNWKNTINIIDIQEARQTYQNSLNQIPSTLEPVSTVGDIENGLLKMFHGIAEGNDDGNYILTAQRSIETESYDEESEGKFIAFDVFLKTNKNSRLYLTPASNITYAGEESFGIENSIRVAFIEEGNVPTGTGINTIQGLFTNSSDNVYFWEPNYNTHTENGIYNARNVYGINVGLNSDIVPYDGVSAEIKSNQRIIINNANSTNYPNYFKRVNINYYTETNFEENVPIFEIKNGITKYRIYMWVEGQDIDCENNASVGNISLNLQLTTNPS